MVREHVELTLERPQGSHPPHDARQAIVVQALPATTPSPPRDNHPCHALSRADHPAMPSKLLSAASEISRINDTSEGLPKHDSLDALLTTGGMSALRLRNEQKYA